MEWKWKVNRFDINLFFNNDNAVVCKINGNSIFILRKWRNFNLTRSDENHKIMQQQIIFTSLSLTHTIFTLFSSSRFNKWWFYFLFNKKWFKTKERDREIEKKITWECSHKAWLLGCYDQWTKDTWRKLFDGK